MVLYTTNDATGFRFYLGVAGKVDGDWTKTLTRDQTATSSERVTVREEGSGWYFAQFTPTTSMAHYELGVKLTTGSYVVHESFFDKTLTSGDIGSVFVKILQMERSIQRIASDLARATAEIQRLGRTR